MNKKLFGLILVVVHGVGYGNGGRSSSGLHTHLPAQSNLLSAKQRQTAQVVVSAATVAGISYAADKIIGQGDGKNFYNGKYAWGFSQALKFTGVGLTVAPFLNYNASCQLVRYSLRAPIIAGIVAGVSHNTTQQVVAKLPVVGQYLSTCDENGKHSCGTGCHGLCTRCGIPKILVMFGLYMAADPYIDVACNYVGTKLGIIPEEEEFKVEINF